MLVRIAFFTLASIFFLALFTNGFRCKRRLCYLDVTSTNRRGKMTFSPRNINPFHCTHIIYYIMMVVNDTARVLNDVKDSEVFIFIVNGLRATNPRLKTLMAVNFTCGDLQRLGPNKALAQSFMKNLIALIQELEFNGAEIKHEYSCLNETEDRENINSIVREMYDAFHEEHLRTGSSLLILALSASAKRSIINRNYDVVYLTRYVDMFNLETDDFRSGYEDTVGHFSPLYGDYRLDVDIECVDYAVRYWISKGAPGNKINIGLGLFGVTYEISRPYMHYIGSTAVGPGAAGVTTQIAGFLAYYEVCNYIRWDAAVFRARDQEVPHLVYGHQWVGYEDEWSLTNKVNYVLRNQLGGVAIWAFDTDDFVGESCIGYSYPLMNAITSACENSTSK